MLKKIDSNKTPGNGKVTKEIYEAFCNRDSMQGNTRHRVTTKSSKNDKSMEEICLEKTYR